jgi:hypothetical protein
VAGELLEHFFDMNDGLFFLEFKGNPFITSPTDIFLPDFHFAKGFEVAYSGGKILFDKKNSLLLLHANGTGEQRIVIRKK